MIITSFLDVEKGFSSSPEKEPSSRRLSMGTAARSHYRGECACAHRRVHAGIEILEVKSSGEIVRYLTLSLSEVSSKVSQIGHF